MTHVVLFLRTYQIADSPGMNPLPTKGYDCIGNKIPNFMAPLDAVDSEVNHKSGSYVNGSI